MNVRRPHEARSSHALLLCSLALRRELQKLPYLGLDWMRGIQLDWVAAGGVPLGAQDRPLSGPRRCLHCTQVPEATANSTGQTGTGGAAWSKFRSTSASAPFKRAISISLLQIGARGACGHCASLAVAATVRQSVPKGESQSRHLKSRRRYEPAPRETAAAGKRRSVFVLGQGSADARVPKRGPAARRYPLGLSDPKPGLGESGYRVQGAQGEEDTCARSE